VDTAMKAPSARSIPFCLWFLLNYNNFNKLALESIVAARNMELLKRLADAGADTK